MDWCCLVLADRADVVPGHLCEEERNLSLAGLGTWSPIYCSSGSRKRYASPAQMHCVHEELCAQTRAQHDISNWHIPCITTLSSCFSRALACHQQTPMSVNHCRNAARVSKTAIHAAGMCCPRGQQWRHAAQVTAVCQTQALQWAKGPCGHCNEHVWRREPIRWQESSAGRRIQPKGISRAHTMAIHCTANRSANTATPWKHLT